MGVKLRKVAEDVANVQTLVCLALHFANAVENAKERMELNDLA